MIIIFDLNSGGAGAVTGANNGLHLNGTIVQAGGSLNQITDIDLNGFRWEFVATTLGAPPSLIIYSDQRAGTNHSEQYLFIPQGDIYERELADNLNENSITDGTTNDVYRLGIRGSNTQGTQFDVLLGYDQTATGKFKRVGITKNTFGIVVQDTVNNVGLVKGTGVNLVTQLGNRNAYATVDCLDASPIMPLKALGSQIKSYVLGEPICINNNPINLGAGNMFLTAHVIPIGDTITSMNVFQSTLGNYTPNNFNGIGLYSLDVSSGLLSLVATSNNIPAVWSTGTGLRTIPFSAAFPILNPGVYYTAVVYNSSAQVTAPGINFTMTPNTTPKMDFPHAITLQGTVSMTGAALPASFNISTITTNFGTPYGFLS